MRRWWDIRFKARILLRCSRTINHVQLAAPHGVMVTILGKLCMHQALWVNAKGYYQACVAPYLASQSIDNPTIGAAFLPFNPVSLAKSRCTPKHAGTAPELLQAQHQADIL